MYFCLTLELEHTNLNHGSKNQLIPINWQYHIRFWGTQCDIYLWADIRADIADMGDIDDINTKNQSIHRSDAKKDQTGVTTKPFFASLNIFHSQMSTQLV